MLFRHDAFVAAAQLWRRVRRGPAPLNAGAIAILIAALSGVTVACSPWSGVLLGGTLALGALIILLVSAGGLRIVAVAILLRASLEVASDHYLLAGLNPAGVAAVLLVLVTPIVLVSHSKTRVMLGYRSLPYLLLVGLGCVSALSRRQVGALSSAAEMLRAISNISVYWLVVAFVEDERDLRSVRRAIVYSSLVPLLFGFLAYLWGYSTIRVIGVGLRRMQSFFAHPNNYAHYLLIVFLASFALTRSDGMSTLESIAVRALQVLFVVSIGLTFSRSAIVGLVVASLLLGLKEVRVFMGALAGVAVGLLALRLAFPSFVAYLPITLASDSPSVSTLAGRRLIWERASAYLGQATVLGYGPGSFRSIVGIDAHSDPMRIVFEYGLPGLVAFSLFWLLQLRDGCRVRIRGFGPRRRIAAFYRRAKREADAPLDGYASPFLALMVSIALMGTVANIFNAPVLQWYVFAFWGTVVAQKQRCHPRASTAKRQCHGTTLISV